MSKPIDNTPINPATGSLQPPTTELAPKRRVNLIPASTVKSEHLDWLIPNWVPHRSITLLAGREGQGKSTIACGIAAQATTGELTGTPINVAYVATEDSLSITVKPRLQAADADLDRVLLLNVTTDAGHTGALSLPGDIRLLADALKENDVKLVILDAAKSAMHSSLDGYRDDDVRQFLEPLAALCDSLDIVVIGLVHFGKKESTDPGKLILGSIAWSQIARSVLAMAVDKQGTLVVTNTKANLAPKQVSREARIKSVTVPTDDGKTTEVGCIEWGEFTDRSAIDLLESSNGDDVDARNEAEKIVVDFLVSQGGSAPANVVRKQVTAAGLAWKTVQNNRKKWGITTRQREDGWVWTLEQAHPDTLPHTCESRDVGCEQVDTTKSRPEQGHIPRPTDDDTSRDVPVQFSQAKDDPRANIDDPTGTNLQSGHGNAYDPTDDPAGLRDTEQAVLDALGSYPTTERTLRGSLTQAQLASFGVDDLTPVLDDLVHRGLAKEEQVGKYQRIG